MRLLSYSLQFELFCEVEISLLFRFAESYVCRDPFLVRQHLFSVCYLWPYGLANFWDFIISLYFLNQFCGQWGLHSLNSVFWCDGHFSWSTYLIGVFTPSTRFFGARGHFSRSVTYLIRVFTSLTRFFSAGGYFSRPVTCLIRVFTSSTRFFSVGCHFLRLVTYLIGVFNTYFEENNRKREDNNFPFML